MSEKSKLELVDYSDKEGSKISEHKTLVEVIVGSDGKDVEVRNEITQVQEEPYTTPRVVPSECVFKNPLAVLCDVVDSSEKMVVIDEGNEKSDKVLSKQKMPPNPL